MVFDCFRWSLTVFDGFQLFSTVLDDVWWFSTAFDGPKSVEYRWEWPLGGRCRFFEQRATRGTWKYGWEYALMEMLVDPVLMEWVPAYIVEQYKRQNPFFTTALKECCLLYTSDAAAILRV